MPVPAVDLPNPVAAAVTGVIDTVFEGFFTVAQTLMEFVFKFVDETTSFSVGSETTSAPSGTVAAMWPMTLALGGAVALALASWQIISSLVRGDGKDLARVVVGLAQFGLITASIVAVVQAINVVSDELSTWILDAGLSVTSFKAAGEDLFQTGETAIAAVLMLIFGIVGILGAVVLWIEFAFRQIAVVALVATSPIAAAGFVSGSTRQWFPTAFKWTVAALLSKPAIALVLVIGVKMLSAGEGLNALLGGAAALVVATLMPFAMVRLFSFVDSGGSGRGGSGRLVSAGLGYTAGRMSRGRGGGAPGVGSPTGGAPAAATAGAGAAGGGGGGGGATETATQTRLANAATGPMARMGAVGGVAAGAAMTALNAGGRLGDAFGDHLDKSKVGDTDWRGDSSHLTPESRQRQGGQAGRAGHGEPGEWPSGGRGADGGADAGGSGGGAPAPPPPPAASGGPAPARPGTPAPDGGPPPPPAPSGVGSSGSGGSGGGATIPTRPAGRGPSAAAGPADQLGGGSSASGAAGGGAAGAAAAGGSVPVVVA